MQQAESLQRIRRYFRSIRVNVGALFQERSGHLFRVYHDDLLVKETGVDQITSAKC